MSHPSADPKKTLDEVIWDNLKGPLGWTGTEDELLRELKRLAREKGIDYGMESPMAFSSKTTRDQ